MRGLLPFALLACSAGPKTQAEPVAAPEPAREPAPAVPELTPDEKVCVQLYEKARDCSEELVSSTANLRIDFDDPPGTAAYGDRPDELIEMMTIEWQAVSQDDACDAVLVDVAWECTSIIHCRVFSYCMTERQRYDLLRHVRIAPEVKGY